jgi:hypothetical protein
VTPSPSPHFHPHRDDDLLWLVKALATDGALRINCGGGRFRDRKGGSWSEDRFYVAGWPLFLKTLDEEDVEVSEPALRKTARWFFEEGNLLQAYKVPLPVGQYRLHLHFLEGEKRQTNARKFDIVIESVTRRTEYEPLSAGFGVPEVLTFEVPVTDGTLDLDFERLAGDPQLSGLVIERL